MKNKVCIMLLLVLTFILCSCANVQDSFSISSDNKITETFTIAYEKAATDAGLKELGLGSYDEIQKLPVKTIDGTEYYIEEEANTYTAAEFEKTYADVLANKNKFYAYFTDINEDLSLAGADEMVSYIDFISFGVTLPSAIVKTNGTKDGDKTATWKYTMNELKGIKNLEMYAYTANDPGNVSADRQTVIKKLKAAMATPTPKPDKKAPVIKGVKNNKKYKKKATVYVKDNVKIKKVTVNGKKVKLTKVKKGKYKGYYKFTVKKKGKKKKYIKYKIIATDTSGNKKKVTIKIK
ncbi:MAG: hypothetical protein J1E62_07205 [Lachnospiraceae bacterium]|nr:hypothetical protein [Lachnospiraceae bacterium]